MLEKDKDIWQSIREKAIAYGREMVRKQIDISLPPLNTTVSTNRRQITLIAVSDNDSQNSA